MIKNVVFDIGNVLAGFAWREFLVAKGVSKDLMKRFVAATVMTPEWNEFDKGLYTDDEILKVFVSYDPELADLIENVLRNIHGMIIKYEYSIPWIKQIKEAGYKVYYLSNFSGKAYTECSDALDFIEYMDGGVLSFREHVIKPSDEIYQILLNRYELVPEECLYFDDLAENVEGACRNGMKGFIFTTKEQAEIDMKSVGVNI